MQDVMDSTIVHNYAITSSAVASWYCGTLRSSASGCLEVIRWTTTGLGTADWSGHWPIRRCTLVLLLSEIHRRTHEIALAELDPAMA